MIKTLIKSAMNKLGFQIIRSQNKTKKYGPTPGYHRLDKLPALKTVIDVGVGHQGSPYLYQRFENATFISIDPLYEAEQALHQYFKDDDVYFIQKAVGRSPQEIEFQVSKVPSRTSLFERTMHDAHSSPTETRQAEIDTLDNLIDGWEIKRPALLKIDIEGGEMDCLEGGGSTLESVDYVLLEAPLTNNYSNSYSFSTIIARLAENDFEVFQILKAGNNNVDLLFCRADDPIREAWSYGANHE